MQGNKDFHKEADSVIRKEFAKTWIFPKQPVSPISGQIDQTYPENNPWSLEYCEDWYENGTFRTIPTVQMASDNV